MKKIMFLLATTLIAVACNNEEIVTNDDVQYVSELKLNFGGSRVTPTHNPASGLTFAWQEDEEIIVYENANADAISLYYRYDSSTNSFKPESESYKMVAGNEYFAVKGQRQTTLPLSVEDGKTIIKMDVDRNAEGTGLPHIPMITDVFTADATGTVATMHHLVGVVEIPVKIADSFNETGVYKFSLFVSDGKLANDFTATPHDPYVKSTDEGYDTAYSEEKAYTLSTTATSIFIPVLPGEYTDASLNCYFSEGSTSKNVGNFTVKRGMITKLSEVTFN